MINSNTNKTDVEQLVTAERVARENAITNEQNARIAKDTNLQTQFNQLATAVKLGETNSTGELTLSQSIQNFRFIWSCADNKDDGTGFAHAIIFIPVSIINDMGYGKEFACQGLDNVSWKYKVVADNKVNITHSWYARRIRFYGIK